MFWDRVEVVSQSTVNGNKEMYKIKPYCFLEDKTCFDNVRFAN